MSDSIVMNGPPFRTLGGWSLPARPVGEDDVALLARPLREGHTGVFLPVTHRLAEDSSLASCERF